VTPTQYEPYKAAGANVYMITNYPILNEAPSTPYARNRKICFAGGIKPEWMHENIINCLIECDAEYVLAGPCNPSYLQKLQSLDGWKNVDYRGQIPFEEVPKLMRECSVGMAVLNYSWNTQGRIGTLGVNKVFEYMYAGLPVVCTDFELWKGVIEDSLRLEQIHIKSCGICVNPNNVQAFSDAICHLLNSPNEAEQMGSNGRKVVEGEYNWGIQERKLVEMYQRIAQKYNSKGVTV